MRPACISCPARSTFTCIFAIPAIRRRKTSPAAPPPRHSAASPRVFDMPNTLPTVGTPEALADKHTIASAKAYVDYGLYAVLGEDSIEHVAGADRRRHHRLQALHGQHLRPHPLALHRRDAGSVRSGGADRQAHLAACRDQLDHGTAGIAAARRRPHRADRASGRAPGGGRRRSGGARGDPGRMDRRPHSRAAYLVGRRIAPARRSQGARRRHHRRDLSALSAAVARPTTKNSAASSGSIRRCARPPTGSRCGTR